MKSNVILILGLIFFGGAVFALHTEKMKTVLTCKDDRLFMDGAVDAEVQAGGINFHESIKLYREHNLKRLSLGTFPITKVIKTEDRSDIYKSGEQITLSISSKHNGESDHLKAQLKANLPTEDLAVNLSCIDKKS